MYQLVMNQMKTKRAMELVATKKVLDCEVFCVHVLTKE